MIELEYQYKLIDLGSKVYNRNKRFDAEKILSEYYKSKYNTYLCKSASRKYRDTLAAYDVKHYTGIPDFFYIKNGELIFIEVKRCADGLHINQFKWLQKYSSRFRCIVMFVNFTYYQRDFQGDIMQWTDY